MSSLDSSKLIALIYSGLEQQQRLYGLLHRLAGGRVDRPESVKRMLAITDVGENRLGSSFGNSANKNTRLDFIGSDDFAASDTIEKWPFPKLSKVGLHCESCSQVNAWNLWNGFEWISFSEFCDFYLFFAFRDLSAYHPNRLQSISINLSFNSRVFPFFEKHSHSVHLVSVLVTFCSLLAFLFTAAFFSSACRRFRLHGQLSFQCVCCQFHISKLYWIVLTLLTLGHLFITRLDPQAKAITSSTGSNQIYSSKISTVDLCGKTFFFAIKPKQSYSLYTHTHTRTYEHNGKTCLVYYFNCFSSSHSSTSTPFSRSTTLTHVPKYNYMNHFYLFNLFVPGSANSPRHFWLSSLYFFWLWSNILGHHLTSHILPSFDFKSFLCIYSPESCPFRSSLAIVWAFGLCSSSSSLTFLSFILGLSSTNQHTKVQSGH